MQIMGAGLTVYPWDGGDFGSRCLCQGGIVLRGSQPQARWQGITPELAAPRVGGKHHLPHPSWLHPIPVPAGQSGHREPPVPGEREPGRPPQLRQRSRQLLHQLPPARAGVCPQPPGPAGCRHVRLHLHDALGERGAGAGAQRGASAPRAGGRLLGGGEGPPWSTTACLSFPSHCEMRWMQYIPPP